MQKILCKIKSMGRRKGQERWFPACDSACLIVWCFSVSDTRLFKLHHLGVKDRVTKSLLFLGCSCLPLESDWKQSTEEKGGSGVMDWNAYKKRAVPGVPCHPPCWCSSVGEKCSITTETFTWLILWWMLGLGLVWADLTVFQPSLCTAKLIFRPTESLTMLIQHMFRCKKLKFHVF